MSIGMSPDYRATAPGPLARCESCAVTPAYRVGDQVLCDECAGEECDYCGDVPAEFVLFEGRQLCQKCRECWEGK